jgi:hypothetical protein
VPVPQQAYLSSMNESLPTNVSSSIPAEIDDFFLRLPAPAGPLAYPH